MFSTLLEVLSKILLLFFILGDNSLKTIGSAILRRGNAF
jgi:hypothetical protein